MCCILCGDFDNVYILFIASISVFFSEHLNDDGVITLSDSEETLTFETPTIKTEPLGDDTFSGMSSYFLETCPFFITIIKMTIYCRKANFVQPLSCLQVQMILRMI